MKHALWIYPPALAFGIALAGPAAHAQTISQDYARYAGMLNQERSDSIKRDGQAIVDAGSPRNAGSNSAGSGGGGGSSSSSGGSSAAPSIGMLSGTINDMQVRHQASEAARQKRDSDARAGLAARNAANTKASDDFIAAYEKAHPTPEQIKANAAAEAARYSWQGFQYLKGIDVKQDIGRGISLLTGGSERGDVDATRLLAGMYYNGTQGVDRDFVKSYAFFVKLTDTGDVEALRTVCDMVVHSNGTAFKVADAERYCLPALAKGNASAANNLGFIYSGSVPSVKADRVKAAAYFQKAVDLGMPDALTNMIYMYRGGDGQPADNATINALLAPLVAKGDPTGEIEMGLQYYNGAGLPKDHAKTAALFQKAVDQGSARGMEQLAALTQSGDGVPKDEAKSLKFYRQSAVQGWGPSLFMMGMMTLRGVGVPRDVPEAITLLRLAAEKGDTNAPGELEQVYNLGYGVPKDPVEGKKWLSLCAATGDQDCIDRLKKS